MGLFDRFGSDSSSREMDDHESASSQQSDRNGKGDYTAEEYTHEDLGDDVSVIFADRWPTAKSLYEYELVYAVDPTLEDPIVFRVEETFPVQEGTKLLVEGGMARLEVDGKYWWVSSAMLIDPALAEFMDHDWEYQLPEQMQGRRVAAHPPNEHEREFIEMTAGALLQVDEQS